MPAAPVVGATIDFSNGASFMTNPLTLNDPILGQLDYGQLVDIPPILVDVSSILVSVNVRRGRNRILNKFEAGTANVTLYDFNGDWNPDNPLGAYYGDLKPLRKIQIWADYNGTRYVLFTGFITQYDTTFSRGTDEVSKVTLQCSDGFRLLSNAQVTTIPSSGIQLSGARVNAILDEISWATAFRDIDVGQSTLQADPGTARTAISALRTVEDSEFGGFFIDAEGRATFIDRNSLTESLGTPVYTFSDTGVGIAFQNAITAFDDTLIVNDVTVTRAGGTAQNVFDQPSIDTYFIHSGVRDGILVQTDAEALDQASMLLATRKDTSTRVDSIQLNMENGNDVNRCVASLNAELLDSVEVTKAMPGSTSITQTLLIQGLNHDFTNKIMTTTIFTGESLIDGFILNSLTQGILGTNVLSY